MVNGQPLLNVGRRLVVDRFSQQIENTPQRFPSDRYRDRTAGVDCGETPLESVGRAHGNAADHIVPDMLFHLRREGLVALGYGNGVEQAGQMLGRKPDVQYRPYDLHNRADVRFAHMRSSFPN